jgi:UDP-N-acetyl-D-mannosaminuronate dehydrogenase
MKVGIVGVGYVGSGMRKRLFSSAHEVVGYDPRLTGSHQSDIRSGDYLHLRSDANGARWSSGRFFPCREFGQVDRRSPIIVIKSTVPPGTTDMLGERYRKNLHFSPEYMGEGKQFVAPWRNTRTRAMRGRTPS